MTLLASIFRGFDFTVFFKYAGVMASAFGPAISIYLWVRLKRKVRMFNIRTATLLKLRNLLREHGSVQPRIKLKLELLELRVFGVNAYNISVPHFIGGWSHPSQYLIYTRYDMPNGWYFFTEREDFLIFDLIDEDEETMTNLAFPLRVGKGEKSQNSIIIARKMPD